MSKAELPKKWDHESDVVIIGGGTAGLPAGIAVAEAGQKATILESRPQCGGSFAMIVGGVTFAGSDEQKAAGVDDSPDLFYDDLVNVAGADPEIARAFADNQIEAYKIFKAKHVKWPGIIHPPGHSRARGLGWILGSAPALVKVLEDTAREKGAEIFFRHRASRLIVDSDTGKVIGVKVDVDKKSKYFKARRGVIIATGGFGRNRQIVAEYAPHMVDCVPKMPLGHQGDGLKMALNVGAATKDIGASVAGSWPVCVETHSRAIWALDCGGIMVNVRGQRFYMESSDEGFYGRMTEAAMKQPGGVYWVIFDENIKGNVGKIPGVKERNAGHIKDIEDCRRYTANTLEDLAGKIGVDAKGLRESVDKYNGDIDSVGYDTVFDRKYLWGKVGRLVKITPPYYAIKCTTSTTSMKGGLKIDADCHVLDQFDEVIPGLYAAGEVAGGLWTKSYLLGVMTTAAMVQGIIAGRNVVRLLP